MKKPLKTWLTGWVYLLSDDLVSFNAYFTSIFAEIAYLFVYQHHLAFPFTILLSLCIANVCICSFLKENWLGTKREPIVSRIYVLVFAILIIVGCFVNIVASILLMLTPIFITLICVSFRESDFFFSLRQKLLKKGFTNKPLKLLSTLCQVANLIFQLAIVFGPGLSFCLFLTKTTLSIVLVAFLIVLLTIFMPFIAYIEDNGSCNIFEIAYDIAYDPPINAKPKITKRKP